MDSNTTDIYSVDLTNSITTSIWSDDSLSPNISITSSPYVYSGSGTTPTITLSDDWGNGWNQPSGKMSLKGEDADIDINGVSLMDTLKGIQDQLNMLCPDHEMEQEWDQLREIREQYEAKLQECREKSRAWKALKQQG